MNRLLFGVILLASTILLMSHASEVKKCEGNFYCVAVYNLSLLID